MPIGISSITDETVLTALLAEQVQTNEYLRLLIYGIFPFVVACIIIYLGCKWFKSTFVDVLD